MSQAGYYVEPAPHWGRAKDAAGHYGVGVTTIYSWLNSGRLISRKIDGIRLVLIGAARGIDIEEPLPDVAPVSLRPENKGRHYYGRGRKPVTGPPAPAAAHRGPAGEAV